MCCEEGGWGLEILYLKALSLKRENAKSIILLSVYKIR